MRADAVAVLVNEDPALLRKEILGLRKILGKRIDEQAGAREGQRGIDVQREPLNERRQHGDARGAN